MVLSADEIERMLKTASGWEFVENKLVRNVRLKTFMDGVRLIEKIAAIAEKLNHHPDLFLYEYKNLQISTWTHDEQGVTKNDFVLATQINSLF